jgi:hypothetical protein
MLACGPTAARPVGAALRPTTPTLVRVVASDYAFDSSRTVPAGLLAFRLVNHGHALHMMTVARLDSGKTATNLLPALLKSSNPPGWSIDLGGPNAVSPGDSTTAFLVVEPGSYALICWIPDSVGTLHAARGMISALTVSGTTAGAPVEPLPDVVMREDGYHIDMASALKGGTHTVRVDNDGPQEHDIEIVRLLPGKTAAQALDWLDDPARRAPAGEAIGGVAGIQRWAHGEFSIDLTPGDYVVVCWIPDDKDSRPHFRHGMMRTFTVAGPNGEPSKRDTTSG